MTFRVGQKVVCIDATPKDGHLSDLRKGGIYTISATGHVGKDGSRKTVCLREIHHSQPFYKWRFRPLVERKTDISIFMEMLTRKGVDA